MKSNEPKLALAMIVKNTEEEFELLNRCMESLKGTYDKAFVTVTCRKGEQVRDIPGAEVSFFPWVNDFAAARNFNFSQVPEEYSHILWSDADDIWEGAGNIRKYLDNDAVGVWYNYAQDEHGNCTTAHKKTMVIRNGGAEWVGRLHEDLIPKRDLEVVLAQDVVRVHRPTDEHRQEAFARNEEISRLEWEEKKDDPKTWWNYANSLIGSGKFREAIPLYEEFIDTTGSDEEEYLAIIRMADCYKAADEPKKARAAFHRAIGLKPHYPDAYLSFAYMLYDQRRYDDAIYYAGNGLKLPPPTDSIIVYNPRDYDYNPLMLLSKCYYMKGKYAMSLKLLRKCQDIYPDDQSLKDMAEDMEREVGNYEAVAKLVKEIEEGDPALIKERILAIPKEFENHPMVCVLRNMHFVRKETSGKQVTFFCGYTVHEWNPVMFRTKGVGGSEESVIHLSRQFARLGYDVEVYANVGRDDIVEDGVHWKPYWKFNLRDRTDILFLWRSPALCDKELNAGKIIVDLHDVIKDGEFTKERLAKIHRVLVKSQYHRSLFPSIPDDKVAVIPNGFELKGGYEKRDPMLIINTSSPDRSLSSLARAFRRIKEQVPEAKCEWAYGWEIFDNSHSQNPEMMAWKNGVVRDMEAAGIVNRGRLSQEEVAGMYARASVFAYPSVFPEICCISLTKAQAAGAYPVTTSFGVFREKNRHGSMVEVDTVQGYEYGRFDFGLDDPAKEDLFVEEVVRVLRNPPSEEKRREMSDWARENYSWDKIAERYVSEF